MISRRLFLEGATGGLLLAGCAGAPTLQEAPPIVFVPGNGDTAALWQTTVWRFESNGWPRDRLHVIDPPYPLSRDDDAKPQPGRSSTAEHMALLKAEVDRVLQASGAQKVVLIGNSRGGNAIRNYIQNGGGDKTVSHAVLGGTPSHGVWAIPGFNEGSEFSGTGPFLTALNAPKGPNGDEVTPGVKWLTVRSDNNDKFAQPDGLWIGARGKPTHITFAGPELKGATNVVIPRIDHRETSFSPVAFEATWRFLTGREPASTAIQPESPIVLGGKIIGLGLRPDDPASGNFANNLPLAGARLEVYATDAATGQRRGDAAHRQTVGADGRWGPFTAQAGMPYEFVISAPGYAITHIYRSPFPRSSKLIHLRAERLAEADKGAGAVVTLTRPRGYFDAARDRMSFDGQTPPPGVPPAGAGVSSSKIKTGPGEDRAITAEFNGERLTGRTWPAAGNHLVMLELTY
ncbi:alpha/beta fold hydrolase [Variovorax terrae]|uniref:Twin-arginine translocation pathway signal n=1 Tax=Variovorax terrae TaxID=2923278 RepID=A0A9X1VWT5_9BURK|nr:alpha/beta fold hydrolase [Variovorax terrae]MCJ0765256.1 twin-arginine translocation pathway signal [Variovorax terrae]